MMSWTTDEAAESLIAGALGFAQAHMSKPPFDHSHDFTHIRRVLALSEHLAAAHEREQPGVAVDRVAMQLVAILHDVADHKYQAQPNGTAPPSPRSVLLGLGCPAPLADHVQLLASAVSVSMELREPERMGALSDAHPELAVVQDADRLDAMGAVGVGRAYTFGGAKDRTLRQSFEHFDRLLVRETLMRTTEAKRLAAKRAQRLRTFAQWWVEEMDESGSPGHSYDGFERRAL